MPRIGKQRGQCTEKERQRPLNMEKMFTLIPRKTNTNYSLRNSTSVYRVQNWLDSRLCAEGCEALSGRKEPCEITSIWLSWPTRPANRPGSAPRGVGWSVGWYVGHRGQLGNPDQRKSSLDIYRTNFYDVKAS